MEVFYECYSCRMIGSAFFYEEVEKLYIVVYLYCYPSDTTYHLCIWLCRHIYIKNYQCISEVCFSICLLCLYLVYDHIKYLFFLVSQMVFCDKDTSEKLYYFMSFLSRLHMTVKYLIESMNFFDVFI